MGKKNSKLKQDTIDRLTTATYCEYNNNLFIYIYVSYKYDIYLCDFTKPWQQFSSLKCTEIELCQTAMSLKTLFVNKKGTNRKNFQKRKPKIPKVRHIIALRSAKGDLKITRQNSTVFPLFLHVTSHKCPPKSFQI